MNSTVSTTSPIAGRTSATSESAALKKGQETIGKAVSESTEEIASGKKSGGYSGPEIAEETRAILSAEQETTKAEATRSKIKTLTGHVNQAYSSNKSLQEIATNFHARVTAAQDAGKKDTNFPDFCKNMLGQVENILNKKGFDGRSLFGGNATRTNAVNLDDAAIPGAADQPDATYDAYFKGHDSTHQSTVKGESFDYGFSALDSGVRDLVFWLKSGSVTLPDGDPSSPNGQRLAGMQDGLHNVTSALSDTQKILGEQSKNLERLSEVNDDELAYNETTFAELVHADILEQITRSKQSMMMQELIMHLQSSKTKEFQSLINNI